MRKIAILSSFFLFTPTLLFVSIFYLLFLSYHQKNANRFQLSGIQPISFGALPSVGNSLSNQIEEKDIRVDRVRNFFDQYNSPLVPFAQNVVESADQYNINFRLVPAIAMQESNLCLKAPKNSNNCWGFGIYGKTMTTFSNYAEAIETVTKTLAKDYIGKGLNTPEEIQKKYTPSNNGAWAYSVSHFMQTIQ